MRKKLHPLVLTIAICQVMFGVLALACDGFGLVNHFGYFMMADNPPPSVSTTPTTKGQRRQPGDEFGRGMNAGMEAQITVIQKAPGYKPIMIAQSLFGLFLAVLMIASGSGLFFMQSWARWLAVGYGVISLLARCACVGYHAAVVLPIYQDFANELAKRGDADLIPSILTAKFLPFAGLLLGLYPLLVIILLLLPQVGRAFHGKPAPDTDDLEFRLRDRERLRDPDEPEDRYRFR